MNGENTLKPRITPLTLLLQAVKERMSRVRAKILVISGKGGVGKSFISSSLALALADLKYSVVLLDADLHGSSIPILLGMDNVKLYAGEKGILPATGPLGIGVVSINLMLPEPDTPVIWRGPLKSKAIIELLAKVHWGDRDFLIIDLPPGTGDEALTIIQSIHGLNGALIVTAPNILSEVIVAKAINFLRRSGIKVLGIVENMSYFKCPETGKVYYLLGKSSGEELAEKYNTPLLAKIPLDPSIPEAIEKRKPYYVLYRENEAAKAIRELAEKLARELLS
ncbi:MAG: ATP-binding protein [Thermoprotei archaeon]|nr:MAG: ATP-binding protein [Thermoprotei archaeon]